MPNPSSYYDDAGGDSPAPAPEPGGEGKQSEGQTALVPKSVFGGRDLKPGDRCDIEIVRVHEDAYEVQHPDDGGKEPDAENQQQPEPAEAPSGGFGSMME